MKALILACLLLGSSVAIAADRVTLRSVDLNDPQALDRLATEKPAQFAKIQRILAEAGEQPPEQIAKWMKTSFDANAARYTSILKTSDPPKAELWFVLDDTQYHARVTLWHVRPTLLSGPLRPFQK